MTRSNNHAAFNLENPLAKASLAIVAGLLLSLVVLAYIGMVENGPSALLHDPSLIVRLRSVPIVIACVGAMVGLVLFHKSLLPRMLRFRWPIALVIFVLCVIFEISGSSIGLLIDMMGGDGSTIFGQSRTIRSDEWMTFTPMALSQCTTDGGVFSYFQDSMRSVETDMFCVYGQPVWDIAEVFRPFQWGYLLFGASHGLAFFWSGRVIFLFMVSFEFCYRIIADRAALLSVAYACLIAFAGAVQWWFSVCGLVEMLIFGQLALILADAYLDSTSYRVRLLCSLGIAWCLGVFLLTFYPAWQIPFAYIFLALLVALLVRKLPHSMHGWRDVSLIALVIAIVVATAAYVFLFRSWDTIQQVMNTAYPGNRSSTGGGALGSFFYYPLSVIAPLSDEGILPNVCEASSFYTLFPLSLLLPLAIMAKERKANVWMVCLLVVFALLGCYVAFGLPEFLANATLLSKSVSYRVDVPLGYLLVLLLFFSIPRIRVLGIPERIALGVVSVLLLVIGLCSFESSIGTKRMLVCLVFAVAPIIALLFPSRRGQERIACACLIMIGLLSGALVNPVRGGLSEYFENGVARAIEEASSESSVWATMNSPTTGNNIPASLGHRTMNSTNAYPQLDTWYKIDPDHEYEEIYNRYAHIQMSLTDGPTGFELLSPDKISIEVTTDDIHELGITNAVSYGQPIENEAFELITETNGFYFYHVRG